MNVIIDWLHFIDFAHLHTKNIIMDNGLVQIKNKLNCAIGIARTVTSITVNRFINFCKISIYSSGI